MNRLVSLKKWYTPSLPFVWTALDQPTNKFGLPDDLPFGSELAIVLKQLLNNKTNIVTVDHVLNLAN